MAKKKNTHYLLDCLKFKQYMDWENLAENLNVSKKKRFQVEMESATPEWKACVLALMDKAESIFKELTQEDVLKNVLYMSFVLGDYASKLLADYDMDREDIHVSESDLLFDAWSMLPYRDQIK